MARPAASTPATVALTARQVPFTVHAYEHDPRERSFGLEAARRLGLDPQRVFKTLLTLVDDEPIVGIVPVSATLDLKSLAQVIGGRRAAVMPPADAERLTGYIVGGISPIGQKRACRTVIDETAMLFDTVYVSGGRRGLDLGIAPDDLLAVTGGAYAAIARDASH